MVRFKNRYIVIEVNPDKMQDAPLMLHPAALSQAILRKVEMLHGEFGVAVIKAGFLVKYCNEWTRVALVRVRHGPHRLVASCLPFVNELDRLRVTLHTLYVGATLCQCYKFVRLHQKSKLEKMWSKLRTDEEKKEMEAAVMDLTPLERFGKYVPSASVPSE